MLSAWKDHDEVVVLLLNAGAEINARNSVSEHYHAFVVTIYLAALLLQRGVTPLVWATQEGHVRMAQLLLSSGALIDGEEEDGVSLMN